MNPYLLIGAAAAGLLLLSRRAGGSSGSTAAPVDPRRCVLVPRCMLAADFPRYYFTTHLTGPYATGRAYSWLASLGADPMDALTILPAEYEAHTLLGEDRDWRVAPDDMAAGAAARATNVAIAAAGGVVTPDVLKSAVLYYRVALDGKALGLSLWPPVAFYSQEHLDAWLAHYSQWRYGWDPHSSKWLVHPSTAIDIMPRAAAQQSEIFPPGNPVRVAFEQTAATWLDSSDEVFGVPTLLTPGSTAQRYFRLSIDDPELSRKVFLLYTFACVQMALYTGGNPFPMVEGMVPMFQEGSLLGSLKKGLPFGISMLTAVKTGNLASIGAAVGRVAATINATTGASEAKDAGLPWHPGWAPVAVPLTELADWPATREQKDIGAAVAAQGPLTVRALFR